MSTDYYSAGGIGILLSYPSGIPKKYRRTEPEKSHLEDRFDPKTGKHIGQVTVTDHEEYEVLHNGKGKEYDVADDPESALYDFLCDLLTDANFSVGIYEVDQLVEQIELETADEDGTFLFIGGAGETMQDRIREISKIYKKLVRLGFKYMTRPDVHFWVMCS